MFGFFKENREIQRVIATRYQVVFYAENAYYFQYYRQLFDTLLQHGVKICYISSQKDDPVFKFQAPNLEAVYSSSTLAFAFQKLQADVMILTMPDLGNFIFKRSPAVRSYVYVFHAMVSTHQQYRSHAFDHYDTIFCVGPHHEKEIREAEALYGLPRKTLVPYGYPLLQDLIETQKTVPATDRILIAPSWYEHGILQTCIHEVMEQLAKLDRPVVIRPHPEFIKRNKKSFTRLEQAVQRFPQLSFDRNPVLWESLLSCGQLITDRSGIAFEFAFVKRSPVVFVDTPLKIQNSEVNSFSQVPVENLYREEIGISVEQDSLGDLPDALRKAENETQGYAEKIETVRKSILYENGAGKGTEYILTQIS